MVQLKSHWKLFYHMWKCPYLRASNLDSVLSKIASVWISRSPTSGERFLFSNFSLSTHWFSCSSLGTCFTWKCPEKCFKLSPSSGELPPKTTCKLSVSFTPDSAKVYSVLATCSYGKEGESKEKKVELKGVGKYPHVVVSLPHKVKERQGKTEGAEKERTKKTRYLKDEEKGEEGEGVFSSTGKSGEVVVGFGSVAVGTTAEKWIELINVSPVSNFKFKHSMLTSYSHVHHMDMLIGDSDSFHITHQPFSTKSCTLHLSSTPLPSPSPLIPSSPPHILPHSPFSTFCICILWSENTRRPVHHNHQVYWSCWRWAFSTAFSAEHIMETEYIHVFTCTIVQFQRWLLKTISWILEMCHVESQQLQYCMSKIVRM